jgi:flagellar basal body-associated protein FliL
MLACTLLLASCSEEEEVIQDVRVQYTLGEFMTNLSDSRGSGGIRLNIILVLNREGFEDTLRAEDASIRHTIIFLLRNLTVAEVDAPGGQDMLADMIIDELNELLGVGHIIGVLFSDFRIV